MPAFLTVREAAERTGKSPSSIRRILYPIIQNDKHPEREQIQPSVQEALQLRIKGENFAWRLSEELLEREVPVESRSEHNAATQARSGGQADGELIAMLRRELDIKNQQIAQQGELLAKHMELVNGLSERLREGNILIGSLQQRLALNESRDPKPTEAAKPKPASAGKSEKGSVAPAKATKNPPPASKPTPSTRGLFSRLFRPSR